MRTNSAFTLCAATTTLSAVVSAGFSLAAVAQTHVADQLALYGAARSVPLAVAAIAAWRLKSVPAIVILCCIMSAVQFLDAGVGLHAGDMQKTAGPAILALLTLASLASLRQIRRKMP